MASNTVAGHTDAMEIDELESFANSDPREFQRGNGGVKQEDVGRVVKQEEQEDVDHAVKQEGVDRVVKEEDVDRVVVKQEDVDLNMDNWTIRNGAPRAPRAMLQQSNASRSYRTPSSRHLTQTQREKYISAQEAWEDCGGQSQPWKAEDDQENNMSDYERGPYENRRYHRRGGGRGRYHGGGGGGRKRNRQEYDEDNYDRPPPGGPHQRVRSLIVGIADSPMRDPVEDAEALATMIAKDWHNDQFREHISDAMLKMVLEQPLKIPYVAGIILSLNLNKQQLNKPEIVSVLLAQYAERAQQAVQAAEWRSLKLLLRLLACVHGLFQGTPIFAVLDELLDRAIDLQTASSDDALGLELTKIILLTIPFALAAPGADREALKTKAAELLDKTEVVATAPPASEDMINPYISVEGEEAPTLQPVLKLLQLQLRNEQSNGWQLKFLPKYFQDPTEGDLMEGMGDASNKQDFPTIEIPATITPGKTPVYPEVYFSCYADQDVETVPPTRHLAASVMRDVIADTINALDFNRTQTAKYLVELDCYWPKRTFAKRAALFEKLRAAEEGEPTWKVEDVAIDGIFSQMMKLPDSEHRSVYYHSLITEMCTQAPQAIAPSLGRAIRFLYSKLNIIDLELAYRYADWFSHHLSNFDYRWKWVEWEGDADLSPMHCRKAFILGLLDKEVRLSFANRIRKSLPQAFAGCIPTSRDNDIPEFKYRDESTPFSSEAKQLVDCLRSNKPDEQIGSILEKIVEQASTDSTYPAPQLLAIDAFVTAIVYVGSKSLSHALSFVERHKGRLLSFAHDPLLPSNATDADPTATANANRVQIVASVVNYWSDVQIGVAVSLVDKLLNYGIVLPSTVVDWAFGVSDPASFRAGRALPDTWLFELMSGTLGKVMNRVSQIAASRAEAGIPKPHADQVEQTLTAEMESMKNLFRTVDDVLVGVAEGSNDEMIEEGMGEVVGEGPDSREIQDRDQLALLKMWGQKWQRVFRRKVAAQEKKVREGMLRWPEPTDPAAALADGQDNGVDNMDTAEADGV